MYRRGGALPVADDFRVSDAAAPQETTHGKHIATTDREETPGRGLARRAARVRGRMPLGGRPLAATPGVVGAGRDLVRPRPRRGDPAPGGRSRLPPAPRLGTSLPGLAVLPAGPARPGSRRGRGLARPRSHAAVA